MRWASMRWPKSAPRRRARSASTGWCARRGRPRRGAPPSVRTYGRRFLVRGGKSEIVEGNSRTRHVVIEFQDYSTALACYRSPEYQRAMALRKDHSVGDIMVIEGYDGPQPTDS